MLSAPVLITPPAIAPLTLDEVKDFLRRDDTSLDGPLQIMIDASIGELETTTSLRLIEQTVDVRADAFADLAALNVGPISAVTELRYRDPSGVEQMVDPASYYLAGTELERGIERVPGFTLPRSQARRGAITARLAVGYGTDLDVPQQLRWALFALIRGKFEDRTVDIEPLIVNHRIYC